MLYEIHSARVVSVFFIFLLLYLVALCNLYVLQIKQSTYFEQLARQQYHVTITKNPPRAQIHDRHGKALAINKDSLAAFITPHDLKEKDSLVNFLKIHYPKALQRLNKQNKSQFMYIKRRLTTQQIEELKAADLDDIKFLKEPSRYYTLESIGPVVGLTDIDNQGTLGIELMYNAQLAGKCETVTLEKDARSGHFYFTRKTKIEGATGNTLALTLDNKLQFLTYESLKDAIIACGSKEASAIILNGATGEILAMATAPDFDPNSVEQLDINLTKNRIIGNAYELGSVIKVFLALAALEEQVITPDELIDCENSKQAKLNGFKFSTWKAHGIQTFSQVIEGSNNIGVAKVALRLGNKLYDNYSKLGFGKKLDILPGEHLGYVNPPHKWSHASPITLSFGYEMSANLLQLARATTVLCNNGKLINPSIILHKPGASQQLYSSRSITQMREILKTTASSYKFSFKNIDGLEIMGKTGTARMLTNGNYDANKHIFTYVGIVEKGPYKRIIITCMLESTQKNPYASTTAAPLFDSIAHKMLIHDKIA